MLFEGKTLHVTAEKTKHLYLSPSLRHEQKCSVCAWQDETVAIHIAIIYIYRHSLFFSLFCGVPTNKYAQICWQIADRAPLPIIKEGINKIPGFLPVYEP